jgi:hypothetical protein
MNRRRWAWLLLVIAAFLLVIGMWVRSWGEWHLNLNGCKHGEGAKLCGG